MLFLSLWVQLLLILVLSLVLLVQPIAHPFQPTPLLRLFDERLLLLQVLEKLLGVVVALKYPGAFKILHFLASDKSCVSCFVFLFENAPGLVAIDDIFHYFVVFESGCNVQDRVTITIFAIDICSIFYQELDAFKARVRLLGLFGSYSKHEWSVCVNFFLAEWRIVHLLIILLLGSDLKMIGPITFDEGLQHFVLTMPSSTAKSIRIDHILVSQRAADATNIRYLTSMLQDCFHCLDVPRSHGVDDKGGLSICRLTAHFVRWLRRTQSLAQKQLYDFRQAFTTSPVQQLGSMCSEINSAQESFDDWRVKNWEQGLERSNWVVWID